MKKIMDAIDAIYLNSSMKSRVIAKSMFLVCAFIAPFFLYGAFINIREKDMVPAVIEGCFALFLISGIPLIFKKKIEFLSSAFIYTALVVGLVVGVLTKGPSLYASYMAFVFLIPSLVSLGYLGQSVRQAFLACSLGIGAIIYSYFFKAVPAIETAGATADTNVIVLLIVPVMMAIIISFLIIMIVFSSQTIIRMLSDSEVQIQERLSGMTSFIQSLKETINIGESLNGSAKNSLDYTDTISGNLSNMEDAVENLRFQIESTQNIHQSISRAGLVVQEGAQTQSSAVEQSASAVEEMASSIVQMSKTAESRRDLIEELVETEKEVSLQIRNGQRSFDKVKNSAGEMLNVVSVISDIAERTNLLAMNAAIEAAHAGASGRGFAVVAQEIRKLAEEAGQNSQKIKDIIEASIRGIDQAVEINSHVGTEYHNVSGKVQEIDHALSEIINGFTELASGTREITNAVENLMVINDSVQVSISEVTDELDKGRNSIDQISSATDGIISSMNRIAGDSRNIRDEAENIYKIGKDNVQHIRLLEEKIS